MAEIMAGMPCRLCTPQVSCIRNLAVKNGYGKLGEKKKNQNVKIVTYIFVKWKELFRKIVVLKQELGKYFLNNFFLNFKELGSKILIKTVSQVENIFLDFFFGFFSLFA